MYVWKSSAHTQQGYKRANSRINDERSVCCAAEGDSGYVAATVWRNVQVLRPSCSTSAGHSACRELALEAGEGGVVAAGVAGVAGETLGVACLAIDVHAENWLLVLHARQLKDKKKCQTKTPHPHDSVTEPTVCHVGLKQVPQVFQTQRPLAPIFCQCRPLPCLLFGFSYKVRFRDEQCR